MLLQSNVLRAAVFTAGFTALLRAHSVQAQAFTPGDGYQGPPVAAVPDPNPAPILSAQQIDSLTAPIALYPDPLLALLLPAATYPDDIAAAAQWMLANPQPTQDAVNAQQWDSSVKAIVRYPTVLRQMAGNMEWTQTLGIAFLYQQQDVMNSIQRLRAQAQAVGTLQSTPQQQVVPDDNNDIEILPAQPDVLYVPTYDPLVCYTQLSPLEFYDPFAIGIWCDFGFDWDHHFIAPGYRWDRFRPGHPVEHRPEIATHPWVRDNRRGAPAMPPHNAPEHGTGSAVRPGYEKPSKLPPAGAFSDAGSRSAVENAAERGYASQPPVVRPAPLRPPVLPPSPARPLPIQPAPRPAPPSPRPASAPVVHPAPAPVFRPGNSGSTNAQSGRGNQSMHR